MKSWTLTAWNLKLGVWNKLLSLVFFGLALPSLALDFEPMDGSEFARQEYDGVNYAIFHTYPKNVRLLWKNADGEAYATMRRAGEMLEAEGLHVAMMMNAGIFTENRSPAGLWIENGKVIHKLNTHRGKGNFHIQPNGVFYLRGNRANIVTTATWQKYQPKATYAVQSGPMLVIDGKVNSRLSIKIDSPYKRNGVCITKSGELYFVISTHFREHWPNLYEFARALASFGCYNALYLDGNISNYYVPGKSGWFHWKNFVGMIAVTTPQDK